MRRTWPGGISPFRTQSRPSVYNKLPPEEMIERRGERAVWLRCIRTPDGVSTNRRQLPGRISDDGKGFIHGYQKTFRIPEETTAVQAVGAREVLLKFGPPVRINRAYVFRHPDQGGDIPLKVTEVTERGFRYTAPEPVEYWHEIRVDYEVSLIERVDFEVQFRGGRTASLSDLFPSVLVQLEAVHAETGSGYAALKPEAYTHDFLNIHFRDGLPAGLLKIRGFLYDTVPVAYKEIRAGDQYPGQIPMDQGSLEAVLSPWYNLSENDLIILTNSWHTRNDTLTRIKGRGNRALYRFPRGPVRDVEQVWYVAGERAAELPPENCLRRGFNELEISGDIQPESISVIYSHYPQFRVSSRVSFSGLEQRVQPRAYTLLIDTSSIILAEAGT